MTGASDAVSLRLSEARLADMTLFLWATAEPLAAYLATEQLGLWRRFIPGRVVRQTSAERVLILAALRTHQYAVTDGALGDAELESYIRACGGDQSLLLLAKEQQAAVTARDHFRAGLLLAELIDAELCDRQLGGQKLELAAAMPIWIKMAAEQAVRAASSDPHWGRG